MFEKIKTILGPELLKPGTAVICFPVNGPATPDINLSDEKNFTLYEVAAIRNEVISLRLAEEVPHDDEELYNKYIIKFFWELIEEEKWWARLSF